jgi:hypothetical protein
MTGRAIPALPVHLFLENKKAKNKNKYQYGHIEFSKTG